MSASPASSSCCAAEDNEQVDGKLFAACFTTRTYLPVLGWVQEDRPGDEFDVKAPNEVQGGAAGCLRLTIRHVSGHVATCLFHEVDQPWRDVKERIQAKHGYPVDAQHLVASDVKRELLDDELIPGQMHPVTLVLDKFKPSDALLRAARHGHELAVRALFSRESDPERRREMLQKEDEVWEQTPLLWAARGGKNPAVDALLEAASPKERDAMLQDVDVNFWSPLHWAAYRGKRMLCDKLLNAASTHENRNALLEERTDEGRTPLDLAVQQRGSPVLPVLFEHSSCQNRRTMATALLSWRDADHRSLLHHVQNWEAFLDLLVLAKEFFAEGEAMLMAREAKGYTALHLAASSGSVPRCRALLELARHFRVTSAACTSQNRNGWSPLHAATARGHESVLHTLLQEDMPPHERDSMLLAKDEVGGTALHLARTCGHVTKLLTNVPGETRRSMLLARDNCGDIPLHAAATRGQNVVRGFVEAEATLEERREMMLNAKNNKGQTPLHVAVRSSDTIIQFWYLARGGLEDAVAAQLPAEALNRIHMVLGSGEVPKGPASWVAQMAEALAKMASPRWLAVRTRESLAQAAVSLASAASTMACQMAEALAKMASPRWLVVRTRGSLAQAAAVSLA